MKHLFGLLAALLLLPISTQAQSNVTQTQIDAAPACGKGRDLIEGEGTVCACKAKGFDRFVWGTGPYTGHSDICTAARHAGVITKAQGGVVVATGMPGQKEYTEGEANGIKGRRWGRYSSSFDVKLAAVVTGAVAELPTCQRFSPDAAPYACTCPAAAGAGASVWGSGPYTGDSDVCTAARHSGAIGAEGGAINLTLKPGQDSFAGSEANGVQTRNWGSYDPAFMPLPILVAATGVPCKAIPLDADQHSCDCAAGSWTMGSAWGSGPYTADSAICVAARHAGVLGDQGGAVNVLRVRGLADYKGSAANGAKTGDWGGFDTSITFNLN